MTKYKLGPKAGFFYDPTTQKKVLPGKEVEFSSEDLLSQRTKSAINSGHLVSVGKSEKPKEVSAEDLLDKFNTLYEDSNKTKVIKGFKLDELKQLAESRGFEIDPKDTKEQLVDALIEDLYEDEDETEDLDEDETE